MLEHFDFKNFTAPEDLEIYANAKISRIMDRAPDGASIDALIERTTSGYRCSINIASQAGPFKAEALGLDSIATIDRIEAKLLDQFKFWQSERFRHQLAVV